MFAAGSQLIPGDGPYFQNIPACSVYAQR